MLKTEDTIQFLIEELEERGFEVIYKEDHMLNLHKEPDAGRDFILCDNCNGYIYREDEENYGDDYYELDGVRICEHCLSEYLKEHKKVLS